MTGLTDSGFSQTDSGKAAKSRTSLGTAKFFYDVWSILELKILFLKGGWGWYLIRPLVFPLGMFYFLRSIAPDDPDAVLRVMTGAMVFGVALMMANMLAQLMIQDRFLGRLKLLITMPVSKAAYATGVMLFAALQAAPIVILLVVFALIAGVDMDLTWAFVPMIVVVLISMAGPTLFIASYAPSAEVGGIMANLFGIALVMMSPVFFTMDQAPLLLRYLGWVSPMRYGADGVMKTLSGQTDIWVELVVLGGFAGTTVALGLWKLRWRER
jgi:ABC-type multidrug transport system permease subunit